jgi:hypothetical protein
LARKLSYVTIRYSKKISVNFNSVGLDVEATVDVRDEDLTTDDIQEIVDEGHLELKSMVEEMLSAELEEMQNK